MLLAMVACSEKQTANVENNIENGEVAFEVAKNYFFKKDCALPEDPKITTEEDFNKLFGMATTMGKEANQLLLTLAKSLYLLLYCQ